jgi:hypothetical protein
VDCLPAEEQRREYPELATEELAPVDVHAGAEDLSPFADASLDFVIANHLVEDRENPIAALLEFIVVFVRGHSAPSASHRAGRRHVGATRC